MGTRDEYLDCGCVPPGSLNEPGRHFCGRYNPPVPLPEVQGPKACPNCHEREDCTRGPGCACCAASTAALERVLAQHQLASILPGGVMCTCGAELATLNPPFDDGAVKGEPLALAVHQLQEMEAAQ